MKAEMLCSKETTGMLIIKRIFIWPLLFCLCLTGLGGCTAPIIFQGVSSGAPVAFNSTGRGQGDSAWLARYDDVVQATLSAGQSLSLKLEKREIGTDRSVFHYQDEKESKLEIMIERRTETVTYARLNVGWFGSKSMGRLMARQIVFEMIEANKFLREYHPEEID
jgi:hypothetical protein